MANSLATLTTTERAVVLEKARLARAAKTASRRRSTLRRDFLDAPEWERLAAHYGVRLPPWGEPCAPGVMERFLRQVGRSVLWYREWTNERTLRDFAQNAPQWPARAWAGLVLEQHDRQVRRGGAA